MNNRDLYFDEAVTKLLNDIFSNKPTYEQLYEQPYGQTCRYDIYPTCSELPVSRVIYSSDKTIVYFKDGTKTIVTKSANDSYDKQTAVAYAILKRIFGKIGAFDAKNRWDPYLVDGNGLGLKLEKIAEAGYDQEAEKKNIAAAKAKAKADHLAKQKAEADAAWQRRVQRRAEEILLERAAQKRADSLSKNSTAQILNEDTKNTIAANTPPPGALRTSGLAQIDPKDAWKLYRKPDKPFSEFTDEEKRAYWRYHNAKRRASK